MKPNNDGIESVNLVELTNRLIIEDDRYARLSKRLQILYWILIPIFLVLIIHDFLDKRLAVDIIGNICFMFAMLIFALFFKNYYMEYKYVDYSQPTLIMLKKAAYRYKPFQVKTLWILLAILLVDIGMCLNLSQYFDFIQVQVYFLGSVAIAMLIGLLIWRIRYKPLHDGAKKLIREIEGTN